MQTTSKKVKVFLYLTWTADESAALMVVLMVVSKVEMSGPGSVAATVASTVLYAIQCVYMHGVAPYEKGGSR